MLSVQSVAFVGFLYVFLLFLIAYFGDSKQKNIRAYKNNNFIYALSLAVYCSSWTFYGAVGTMAASGLDYLAIYLGPFLVFIFGYPLIKQIILICKQNNITSVSDFIASRFGKSRKIAVLVTIIAVVGSIPYIALQLKAISMSFSVLTLAPTSMVGATIDSHFPDLALPLAAMLAIFAIFFGTRHLDATEHHRGLILAISFESIVKLLAILAVGYYTVYLLFDGGTVSTSEGVSLFQGASLTDIFDENQSSWQSFFTKSFLSMAAIVLLPRQFHVMIVEAQNHRQFRTAMWVMPIYLVLTSIIVVPIALAGIVLLPNGQEDLYVLTLPLQQGNQWLALVAFLGGLSAATGMVIVATISLSTMVCNDLVMPYLISSSRWSILNRTNLDKVILRIRRFTIVGLLVGAYGYYVLLDSNQRLANIGLLSFAAIVQFLPAFICALYWKRANSKGVFRGLLTGFLIWGYCLLIPTILPEDVFASIFSQGSWLHPQALFGIGFSDPLTHGVIWSLSINLLLIVYYSFTREQSMIERIQALIFNNASKQTLPALMTAPSELVPIHIEAVRVLADRFIGEDNTTALFKQYENKFDVSLESLTQVDRRLISWVQKAIAGVIGGSSAQKVVSDSLLGNQQYLEDISNLVEETSSVLTYNRNLLQATLENISNGISVIDDNLNLVVWNKRYIDLFEYPDNLIYVGKPFREVLEYNAHRGEFGDNNIRHEIKKRMRHLISRTPYEFIRHRQNGTVLKYSGVPMHGGGFVTTYENITDSVRASELLKRANEELEDRVHERTKKLEALTQELEKTTRSKTDFLAAASHDLLQPINAARLFAHSVMESRDNPELISGLAKNIDQSLVTANQLLRALLDVSKLDAGGITPEFTVFALQDLLNELFNEFEMQAKEKNIELKLIPSSVSLTTDRRLLFSVLQNFLSNAIRYTPEQGKVIFGVRRRIGPHVEIQVCDSGRGISAIDQQKIFNEFYRVDSQNMTGLGLGLSIAKRIADLLDCPIKMNSVYEKGSSFSITLPYKKETLCSDEAAVLSNAVSATSLQGTKVLCLDNDQQVLEAMRALLSGWRCDAICVSTYAEAAAVFTNDKPDIVIADYRLDGAETGLDLLYLIKQTNSDDYPAILVTAEQDQSLEDETTQMGFQFLLKPIEPASIKSLLIFLKSN